MYEACTVDDLHEVYDCLGLGEGEIFTAITVAGENESVAEKREEIEEDDFASSASNSSFKSIGEDVMAAAAAKLGVALGGGVNRAEALSKLKIDQEGKKEVKNYTKAAQHFERYICTHIHTYI